ncbi:MAG: hypothetical protein QOE22_441 [Candidatus Parcubacteria bacterium]|jgi:hypothetical protein|nr:hypothetical protein [Candidatus Parcubacteria bacterium]
MSEGYLSWRRAAFWPRYESGKDKGIARDASLVFFAILTISCLFRAVWGGHRTNLLWPPLVYAAFGALWWMVLMGTRWWGRFTARHPKVAKTIDIITLITAWEIRLFMASGGVSKWLKRWWWCLMGIYLLGLYGWQGELLSRTYGIALIITAEVLSELTGLYLAWQVWKRPKGPVEQSATEPPRN